MPTGLEIARLQSAALPALMRAIVSSLQKDLISTCGGAQTLLLAVLLVASAFRGSKLAIVWTSGATSRPLNIGVAL